MTERKKYSKSGSSPRSKSDNHEVDVVSENGSGLGEESLQFTRFSIERSADLIFWIGPNARVLYANETALNLLGYSQRELLALRVFDLDPNFKQKIWTKHWEKIKGLGTYSIESKLRAKDGTETPMEININYLEFNGKEYHIAYARPIAERKMAEEALRESESKFRLLSEQGLLAILIIQEGIIKYANHAAAHLIEFSVDELKSLPEDEFANSIHPEDKAFVMEQARKKQTGERDVVGHYSFRIYTRSKKIKWVDIYSKSVIYEGRNAVFVSLVDITERKRADEVLKNAHDELEFLVNERTVELTEANRQLKRRIFDLYTIFELSRNFNAVLNYETLLDSFVLTSLGQMGAAKAALYLPKEIGGKHFHQARIKGSPPFPENEIFIDSDREFGKYITAFNRPVFIDELEQKLIASNDLSFVKYFERGLVVPLIYQTKLRGVLIISGKESGVRFQDEDIEFLSILANQTAVSIENARLYESEKEALDKLQQAQKLLLQSERLAVLGEFSAKVAHEVNNPLGIIKNYLHLLKRQAGDDEKSNKYVSVVKQEIDRIALIIRQLLEMGKPIHIQFARVNARNLISEVVALMKRQLDDAQIRLSFVIKDTLPDFMAWADGLKQVFMNMIINAKDAIGKEGEIVIEVVNTERTIQIFISDSGPGVDPKHIPHIFEPFYSTKQMGTGTGLGLSVCFSIIKTHNGTLELCQCGTHKSGGCFKIELPIEQDKKEYVYQI